MKSFIISVYLLLCVLFLNINPLVARILAPSLNEDYPPSVVLPKKNNFTENQPSDDRSDSTTDTGNTTNTTDTTDTNCSTKDINKQLIFHASIVIHNSFKDNSYLKPMIGIINSIDPTIKIVDTGINTATNNMLENAYLLYAQTLFWPQGTIFVADMGSETSDTLIIAKTKNGHIVITPNNGMLTLFVNSNQLEIVRILDKSLYKYQTINGQDAIFYVAASIAKENLDIVNIGEDLPLTQLKILNYPVATKNNDNKLEGTIFIAPNHNQVITNISSELLTNTFANANKKGMNALDVLENTEFHIKINNDNSLLFEGTVIFHNDYRAYKDERLLSIYKDMLIVKNLNLPHAPNLANPNYVIVINKGNDTKKKKPTKQGASSKKSS